MDAYERFEELGVAGDMKTLGFVYPFKRSNTYGKDILICTNSDRIPYIEELVSALGDMHFHIAALTEMSSVLLSLDDNENVTLYPGIKNKKLDELFEKCDIYLDINRYDEISDAVYKAFIHDHLIYAYEETIHRRDLIGKEHVFATKDQEKLIDEIRAVAGNEEAMREGLTAQKKWAMSEEADRYRIFA